MYWLQENAAESDPLDVLNIKGTTEFFTEMGKAIKQALDPSITEKFFLRLEQDAKNANAKISNQFIGNAKIVENLIFDLYQKNVELGFEYKDSADYLTTMAGEMGRMISFSEKTVESAIMLGKAMGVSSSEVAKMYAGFTKMGLSQDYAQEKLNKVFEIARKNGLDAGKLTKTVSDNVFKAQAYGFKDGIDGLTKMAAQAQKVGISMELAQKAADKAFDPEGAIEMASAMQMLGGNVGALADPFSLMYMAQSDMGELQKQIGKASASMVDFNKKTGDFTISPEMRRNLTEQAKAMGTTYDELADAAIKFKKLQTIESKIDLGGLDQEQKELISSFAEIGKGGEVKVRIPGTDQLLSVEELKNNSKAMEALEQAQKDAGKSTEQVARDQLSVLKEIENEIKGVKIEGIRGALPKKEDIIEANKIRATDLGLDKLKPALNEVVGAEMNAYLTTIKSANGTLASALKSDELKKGLNLISDAAIIGFKVIENSVTILADILKGNPQMALEDIEKTFEDFKKGSEELLKGSGIEPEKIKEKLENLNVKVDTKEIQQVTPNILNQPITNQDLTTITTKEEKTQTITFDGTSTIKIDIDSTLPKDVLAQILSKEDVKLTVKEQIQKIFSKSYNQDIINVIPIDMT